MKTPPLADLILPAKDHYSAALPYHNWQHALDVMKGAQELIERLSQKGIVVDRPVIMVAAAWHDAGYHEDYKKRGYKTKEHFSAALAADFLEQASVSHEIIKKVQIAILGTIHYAKREELEALVLHRADIANIGSDYKAFRHNNSLLYKEVALHGKQPAWPDWMQGTADLIDKLVAEAKQELPRLGETLSGPESFITNATRNARRLSGEQTP